MSPVPQRPEGIERVVSIEWDAPRAAGQPIEGWRCVVSGEDGKPILTATELTVHAPADGVLWAELTTFAGKDGEPVPSLGVTYDDDGKPRTATFPVLVAAMSVRGAS